MPSNALYPFKMKLDKFDDDIELVDVLRESIVSSDLNPQTGNRVLGRIDTTRHTHLARRRNTDGGRKLIANHLRKTVYAAYVKDIYEEVTRYLSTVLTLACLNGFDADRLVGEHVFKIDARTILKLGNWEAVCSEVAASVLQSLESERSTLQLITKTKNKLGLDLKQGLIDRALPCLEVRHRLDHADGQTSQAFRDKYPSIRTQGTKIRLDFRFIRELRVAVFELVDSFDVAILENGLLTPDQIHS